eukprot:365313-Chlamydomonas_euryale.AAC.15
MANSIEISACGWYVASPAVPFAPSILRALILVSGLLLQASPAYPPRRSLIETPGAAPLHHTVEHVRSDGEVVAFQDVVLTDNELRFTLTSSSALPISAECTPDVQYVELRCAVSCEAPPLSAKLAWLDAASDLENDGADLGDAEVEIIRTEGAEQVRMHLFSITRFPVLVCLVLAVATLYVEAVLLEHSDAVSGDPNNTGQCFMA